jgi:hypothetical protein
MHDLLDEIIIWHDEKILPARTTVVAPETIIL